MDKRDPNYDENYAAEQWLRAHDPDWTKQQTRKEDNDEDDQKADDA